MLKKNIVIFGAKGFVAKYLIKSLSDKGHVIWGITRNAEKFSIKTITKLNYLRWDDLDQLIDNDNIDWDDCTVFHFAANISVKNALDEPEIFINENMSLSLKVASFLKKLSFKPLLIYLSSDRVFGNVTGVITEEDVPKPVDPYGFSKFLGEELFQSWCRLYNLKLIIIRTSNLYGPFQKPIQFISSLYSRFWKGENRLTVGNLDVQRNYLYIDDLIDGILSFKNWKLENSYEVFHFANKLIPLEKVSRLFSSLAEEIYGRPLTFERSDQRVRSGKSELEDFILSYEKAERILSWTPKVDIENGMKKIFIEEGKHV